MTQNQFEVIVIGSGATGGVAALTLAEAGVRVLLIEAGPELSAKKAAIVIDFDTKEVLFEVNANTKNYPASLTKIMTLYILFDYLEKGKLNNKSKLKVSRIAASRSPSKLYLEAGSTIKVEDAMTEEVMTITPERPLEVALQMIEDSGHMSLPVMNEKEELHGIITWSDLHVATLRHERHMTVGDYCVTDLITVTPKQNLAQALDALGYRDIGHLPVVDKADPKKLIGIITKGDIIKAYNRQRFLRKQMSWQE